MWKLGFVVMLALCSVPVLGQTPTPSPPPPSFESQPAPPEPDYADDGAWAALPGQPGPADAVPMGARTVRGKRDIDVFYVHPTTYRARDQWNMDLGNEEVNRWTDASVIARQAGLFNQCCRIFAPRYRQASLLAFSDRFMTGDGGKAYALAYTDVLRAFDQWQAKRNDGRPFVLVGHSQGGEMVMRLLEDRIDGKPLQNRMVAAYAIGIDFSVGYFGKRYRTLRPCERPRQVRCVLAWNAMSPEGDVGKLSTMVGARFVRAYGTEEGGQILCINPLTFDIRKPTAVAAMSKGAVPGDPGAGPLRALSHGKVAASCVKGFLVVEADPALDLRPLPGGSMHYHEFGLFYADIQTNLKKRISAYR